MLDIHKPHAVTAPVTLPQPVDVYLAPQATVDGWGAHPTEFFHVGTATQLRPLLSDEHKGHPVVNGRGWERVMASDITPGTVGFNGAGWGDARIRQVWVRHRDLPPVGEPCAVAA